MATVTIQSRVKTELKENAEQIFDGLGMSMGDAIRIFLQQTVNMGGLPFTPMLRKPARPETVEAMVEFDAGIRYPFTTIQAMLDEPDEE
jgi:DNA-damage-inducible protein J